MSDAPRSPRLAHPTLPTALTWALIAAATPACGPRIGEGGAVTLSVEGPGPWATGDSATLSAQVSAETGTGGTSAVQCTRTERLDGSVVYALDAHDDSVEQGLVLAIRLEGYAGPDAYFRDADAAEPGLVVALSTDLQTFDFTTESGGQCNFEVMSGDLEGTFDCRDIPEYSAVTAAEELFVLSGTWSCDGWKEEAEGV